MASKPAKLPDVTVEDILNDLVAEQESLDWIVAPLSVDSWNLATPSPRWRVVEQIAHLAYFDRAASVAIADPEAFVEMRNELVGKFGDDPAELDEFLLGSYTSQDPAGILAAWREDRAALATAAADLDDGTRVEWYGPSMGAKSFLTARLMEVWAHGQDIVDTVKADREPTDRLKHIAQLGYITRGWSYKVRGLEMPEADVQVTLAAPSGDSWIWGEVGATESISGPAEDFCQVVTQRRHVDDTDLQVDGEAARDWMLKAQAFAGGPTAGPKPTPITD